MNIDFSMGSLHSSFVLLLLASCSCKLGFSCVKIVPDSKAAILVEIGKDFTATCTLPKNSKFSADDIYWQLGKAVVPKEYYTKVSEHAVSVTLNITSDMDNLLLCKAERNPYSYETPCQYGIFFDKEYPPVKPENLSCVAVQSGTGISSHLSCQWYPGMRDPSTDTKYTLFAKTLSQEYNSTANSTAGVINLGTYPIYTRMDVWVEVENKVGKVISNKLEGDAEKFVKPNPPAKVKIISDANISTSFVVEWESGFVLRLKYNIRYCEVGSSVWKEVPQENTEANINSFRLQSLQPYTQYVVQIRCIQTDNSGYWSDWSPNVTALTPEAKPEGKPDLWRSIVTSDDKRNVTLKWKAPKKSNGKILGYDLDIDISGIVNRYSVNSDHFSFLLPKGKMAYIEISANNSVGVSSKSNCFIPVNDKEGLPVVEKVDWSVQNGALWVEWQPLPRVREYLLEWVSVSKGHTDWQREKNYSASIKGKLEPYTRYDISVYPLYNIRKRTNSSDKYSQKAYSQAGKPVTVIAFLQQKAPSIGPNAWVNKTKKSEAEVVWDEIPLENQKGIITNYTIFYKTGSVEKSVTVGPDINSYTLTDLASDSKYVVHVMASTVNGSTNGSDINFMTLKYAKGELEAIVVAVCISFLFLTVLTVLACLNNRELIKKHLWPQVPDPSNSSIGNWSPDFPTKADTPKETTLAPLSVVEVDVFDRKSLCEEDKAVLPLKKDKYLSEEHSSGIGGSSCMSSPRQSVSDSDEGDSGQTTASTIQYSSVVASSYKGQTPAQQPPVFARSESTQPLLDCEEHAEHQQTLDNRNSYFKRSRGPESGGLLQQLEGEEQNCGSLSFCPVDEEPTATPAAPPSEGPSPSYMPQQSGYRPQ
ncbi:interleukin-6 receptor subunit beta [Chanos chanos]|uniref:Interleukin-6 receptor subunit beta n=1 Tax=Chanos chanos TaxID=29144 RepID=A0A6J2USF3_CHACN|nr:interleukin-6 receptor subunit beta [Chanos chanos]